MGSFGIFAIVVTFIFVIYYVVMICLDLFGTKGEKKDSVEVIHAGTPVENTSGSSATTPINVNEEADVSSVLTILIVSKKKQKRTRYHSSC